MPVPLRQYLTLDTVSTAYEMGWPQLDNGELLEAAEMQFDAFITTDQNLRYQQDLASRCLAILVLPTTSWPRIQASIADVVVAVNELRPGDYHELTFSA